MEVVPTVWVEPYFPYVKDGSAYGRTLCVGVKWRDGTRTLVMASACCGHDRAIMRVLLPHAELMERPRGSVLGRLLLFCWLNWFVGFRLTVVTGGAR